MAGHRRDKSSGIYCVFRNGSELFALEYLKQAANKPPVSKAILTMKDRAKAKTQAIQLVADNVEAETAEDAIELATDDSPPAKKPRAKKSAANKPADNVEAETAEEFLELDSDN